VVDAALFRAMVILERNQNAFQRPQHAEAEHEHERRPQHDMHPDRRAEPDFHQQRRPGDDEPDDQDDELRRPVAGIDEAVV
jgi:hypothetical protein